MRRCSSSYGMSCVACASCAASESPSAHAQYVFDMSASDEREPVSRARRGTLERGGFEGDISSLQILRIDSVERQVYDLGLDRLVDRNRRRSCDVVPEMGCFLE